jgi:hypothetical protein
LVDKVFVSRDPQVKVVVILFFSSSLHLCIDYAILELRIGVPDLCKITHADNGMYGFLKDISCLLFC